MSGAWSRRGVITAAATILVADRCQVRDAAVIPDVNAIVDAFSPGIMFPDAFSPGVMFPICWILHHDCRCANPLLFRFSMNTKT